MKRQRRQGTREERSCETVYWRVSGTPRRARTDSRSWRPELVRSARVWHLWATCCVYFTGTPPSGRGLTGNDTEMVNRGHRDCVHMRPEYFDGMQMHEDFSVMNALRWGNLWSSLAVMEVLSMKTLKRWGLRIDPVYLICATQPGVSHTSPIHVWLQGGRS